MLKSFSNLYGVLVTINVMNFVVSFYCSIKFSESSSSSDDEQISVGIIEYYNGDKELPLSSTASAAKS